MALTGTALAFLAAVWLPWVANAQEPSPAELDRHVERAQARAFALY